MSHGFVAQVLISIRLRLLLWPLLFFIRFFRRFRLLFRFRILRFRLRLLIRFHNLFSIFISSFQLNNRYRTGFRHFQNRSLVLQKIWISKISRQLFFFNSEISKKKSLIKPTLYLLYMAVEKIVIICFSEKKRKPFSGTWNSHWSAVAFLWAHLMRSDNQLNLSFGAKLADGCFVEQFCRVPFHVCEIDRVPATNQSLMGEMEENMFRLTDLLITLITTWFKFFPDFETVTVRNVACTLGKSKFSENLPKYRNRLFFSKLIPHIEHDEMKCQFHEIAKIFIFE